MTSPLFNWIDGPWKLAGPVLPLSTRPCGAAPIVWAGIIADCALHCERLIFKAISVKKSPNYARENVTCVPKLLPPD